MREMVLRTEPLRWLHASQSARKSEKMGHEDGARAEVPRVAVDPVQIRQPVGGQRVEQRLVPGCQDGRNHRRAVVSGHQHPRARRQVGQHEGAEEWRTSAAGGDAAG